jgi:hypothetical protein
VYREAATWETGAYAPALGQIAKQMRDLEKEVTSLRSALSKIADLASRV